MKIPRDLSGLALVAALTRDWGYIRVNQEGSHIILQTEYPTSHRIAVPGHKSLRIGTLNGILRAVAHHKGVEKQKILDTL
jgi:predicted RNA binding protein YcfA (HicA-like mRNA interferase family)